LNFYINFTDSSFVTARGNPLPIYLGTTSFLPDSPGMPSLSSCVIPLRDIHQKVIPLPPLHRDEITAKSLPLRSKESTPKVVVYLKSREGDSSTVRTEIELGRHERGSNPPPPPLSLVLNMKLLKSKRNKLLPRRFTPSHCQKETKKKKGNC
jgi:hypothetical protein